LPVSELFLISVGATISHKSSFDHKDVRMAKIQGHSYLGEYTEAASEMDVLDPKNIFGTGNHALVMHQVTDETGEN